MAAVVAPGLSHRALYNRIAAATAFDTLTRMLPRRKAVRFVWLADKQRVLAALGTIQARHGDDVMLMMAEAVIAELRKRKGNFTVAEAAQFVRDNRSMAETFAVIGE